MKYFAWILFIFKTLIVFGQAEFDNTIYDKKVQTVQLMVNGTDDRYPIISLNVQQLKLSFDVIGTNNEYFHKCGLLNSCCQEGKARQISFVLRIFINVFEGRWFSLIPHLSINGRIFCHNE